MLNSGIFKYIKMISPQAVEFLKSIQTEKIKVLHLEHSGIEEGCIVSAYENGFAVIYVSLLHDIDPNKITDTIFQEIANFKQEKAISEICLNLFGENRKLITLARNNKFKVDFEGYHMEYDLSELLPIEEKGLANQFYKQEILPEVCQLFDCAYNELNKENGWIVNYYQDNSEQFHKKFEDKKSANELQLFWSQEKLIGAFILSDNYINDLVVLPEYQNKGYGSYILKCCLNLMKTDHNFSKARLRVATSNLKAYRLYQKIGFETIAFCSEHTLVIHTK